MTLSTVHGNCRCDQTFVSVLDSAFEDAVPLLYALCLSVVLLFYMPTSLTVVLPLYSLLCLLCSFSLMLCKSASNAFDSDVGLYVVFFVMPIVALWCLAYQLMLFLSCLM